MFGKWMFRSTAWLAILVASSALCTAAPPWAVLGTFKPIDADPNKAYVVTEHNGPWLIMASSFSGDGADKQARELVYELRKHYKLPAYTYRGHFDLGEAQGRGIDQFGNPRKFKYAKQDKSRVELDEVAVLVGDFDSVEDADAQKALRTVKLAEPQCLQIKDGQETHQTLTGWRMIQRQVYETMVGKKKLEGPMGHAFITRNPLLPPEFFAARHTVDASVVELNHAVPFSLLDCPGKFTVKVATFKGHVVIKQDEIREIQEGHKEFSSKLAQAAEKADTLTKRLREYGYEAYQFHDHSASIVTVGSFNSVGTPRSDGQTEINPTIHKIMKVFAAEEKTLPGQTAPVTPLKTLYNIPFDAQPIPVLVPKRPSRLASRDSAD
jgi:hypothetical protein